MKNFPARSRTLADSENTKFRFLTCSKTRLHDQICCFVFARPGRSDISHSEVHCFSAYFSLSASIPSEKSAMIDWASSESKTVFCPANFNDSETFELGCIRSMTSLSKSLVKFGQRHNCLTRHRMLLLPTRSSPSPHTSNRQPWYRRYQSKAQANLILLGSDHLADIVAGTVVPGLPDGAVLGSLPKLECLVRRLMTRPKSKAQPGRNREAFIPRMKDLMSAYLT